MEQQSDRSSRRDVGGESPPEFQRALGDLEQAMQHLASSAKSHLSGRAISAIEEVAERLHRIERRRLRRARRRYGDDDPAADEDSDVDVMTEQSTRGSYGVGRHRLLGDDDYRRRRRRRRGRLYRVPEERRIAGVCAGLARRWGVENWVARCAAVTALVFMPQFALVGYWVLYFVMDPLPSSESSSADTRPASGDRREPIAGFDRGVSAPDRMRAVRSQFDRMEGRLRKMEGYVTSSRFELDRAMQEIGG